MNLNDAKSKIKSIVKSSRFHNIVVYLLFAVIALVFWFLTALNDPVQRSYPVEVKITGIPNGIELMSDVPLTVNVAVSAKGRSLIKYDWGNTPNISLNFNDIIDKNGSRLFISEQKLTALLKNTFGESAEILSMSPDSISVLYTDLPPEKVAVSLVSDITTDLQNTIYHHPEIQPDSVLLYSTEPLPRSIVSIDTRMLKLTNLSADKEVKVPLNVPANMKAVPSEVSVKVKVSPLVTKNMQVKVNVSGEAYGEYEIVPLTSTVSLSCLVPSEIYNNHIEGITATVYAAEVDTANLTVPIHISGVPDYVRDNSLEYSPQETEYRIFISAGNAEDTDEQQQTNE